MNFSRPASDDADDHGDQPYEPGNSLMDRRRIGYFSVSYSEQWLGGLQIRAAGGATGEVDIMLDRQQGYMLATGLLRWLAGTVRNWKRRPLANFGMCRECGGTGFRVAFNDEE